MPYGSLVKLVMPLLFSQVSRPVIGPGLGALLGSVTLSLRGSEKRLGGLGCKILVVVVVDLNHRRVDASTEAFDLDECEEPIGRRLALLNSEVLLDRLHDRVATAAAELARGLSSSVESKLFLLQPIR